MAFKLKHPDSTTRTLHAGTPTQAMLDSDYGVEDVLGNKWGTCKTDALAEAEANAERKLADPKRHNAGKPNAKLPAIFAVKPKAAETKASAAKGA